MKHKLRNQLAPSTNNEGNFAVVVWAGAGGTRMRGGGFGVSDWSRWFTEQSSRGPPPPRENWENRVIHGSAGRGN